MFKWTRMRELHKRIYTYELYVWIDLSGLFFLELKERNIKQCFQIIRTYLYVHVFQNHNFVIYLLFKRLARKAAPHW